MFFDTLFCSNSVSNYRQIVLIAFIVLFPSSSIELQKFKCFKQKPNKYPLDENATDYYRHYINCLDLCIIFIV